ncbi:MAG: VOC family protein [Pseudomonadota bacterium]
MPHFEIFVADVAAAKSFYGGLFGWTFNRLAMGVENDYHLIEGDDIGGEEPLSGGIMRRMDATPAAGSPIRGGTMTFEVKDCDERYAWALAHGGAEALPPTTEPGIGRFAYVEDGQGNVVGMITSEGKN